MRKWQAAAAALAAYTAGAGIYMSNRIMYMKKKEESFIQEREIKANRLKLDIYEALPKTEMYVRSPAGYQLKCVFIEPHQTNKWVIICHGVTENKVNSIKYMNLFIAIGFNAVIYDHRRHGESGGRTSSYGHFEKWDLKAVADELKRKKGQEVKIGIHGESMGAAAMLLYAGMIEDTADFYIADCAFSDFDTLLKYQISQEIPLPSWTVLPAGRMFIRLRDGYWTGSVSPIRHIQNIQKPILFIHSRPDTFIPPAMSLELYQRKQGPKQIWLPDQGAHAQSFNENPKGYEERIREFLSTVYSEDPNPEDGR